LQLSGQVPQAKFLAGLRSERDVRKVHHTDAVSIALPSATADAAML